MSLRGARATALLVAGWVAFAHPEPAPAAAPGYERIRASRPDGQKVAVADLTLTRDAFTIQITYGQFHLLAPVEGKVFGAVFQGVGRWELTPATDVERRYLAIRRASPGLRTLSDSFSRMVVFWNDETLDDILARGHREEGRPDREIVAAYEAFLERQATEWKHDVRLRIYRARLQRGNPFYAFVEGETLPPAMLAVDPVGILDGEETALKLLQREQGGWLYSSHRREEIQADGSVSCPRSSRVDVLHYAVDARVIQGTSVEAVATLRFKTLTPGLRFLPLEILPSLRIQTAVRVVEEGEGTRDVALDFAQGGLLENSEAALVFPEPLHASDEVTVRVSYSGDDVLESDGDGNFRVKTTSGWYPNLGARDRATFDLTVHVPPGRQVVSVGRLFSTKKDPDETVSVWKSELPIPAAGFACGTFRLIEGTQESSGTALEAYTGLGTPSAVQRIQGPVPAGLSLEPEALARKALADAATSLARYAAAFGVLPHARLAIVQQSAWRPGLHWSDLVFLPYLAALGTPPGSNLDLPPLAPFIDAIGPHEIAHQWWGNRVQGKSYRDRWIEEGFAEYSAFLVLESAGNADELNRFWERKRRAVVEKSTGSAVSNFEAGAMTLGPRLASSRSPLADQALTYAKGAYILHMLRAMMRDDKSPRPDERFFALLRDFAQEFDGKSVSTEDFKATVEKHMVPGLNATRNDKMDWFFEQWVYGTEIPSLSAKVEIEAAGERKWRLRGTIGQDGVSDRFLTMVPFYLELADGRLQPLGRAHLKGLSTQPLDATVTLPEKPKGVRVNVQHEVLAMNGP